MVIAPEEGNQLAERPTGNRVGEGRAARQVGRRQSARPTMEEVEVIELRSEADSKGMSFALSKTAIKAMLGDEVSTSSRCTVCHNLSSFFSNS